MGFVSNSPEIIPDMEALTKEMVLYILPVWVYKAFTSKYSLGEMQEYNKLRQILPLEDVAHLEILRNHALKSIKGNGGVDYFCGELRSFIYPSYYEGETNKAQSTANYAEIRSSVNLLVDTPSVVNEAMGRLKVVSRDDECVAVSGYGSLATSNPATEVADKLPCRIVALNSTLYIIVEEGFLSYLEKSAGRLAFLSQVLKAAYAVFPVRMVNSSMWYQQYLRALAA